MQMCIPGDASFDAAGRGLFADHEEADQAQEGRPNDDVIGAVGAVAAAVDANAIFEGPDPRAV